MSVPKGALTFKKRKSGSPVSRGVVTPSQASGKLVCCEASSEVSQTAVSVLTNRNYILRPSGRMRYHMLPKSKTSKEERTEVVDVAGIDTRIFTLPREILE